MEWCGNVARRSARAMLSGKSSLISTNCRVSIRATIFAGTGGEDFKNINGAAAGGVDVAAMGVLSLGEAVTQAELMVGISPGGTAAALWERLLLAVGG